MITLTAPAAGQLQRLLREKGPPGQGLRVFVHAGGCAGLQYGMAFEAQARENDTILESQGVRLYPDPFSATYLEGASIDYQDSPEGVGFRWRTQTLPGPAPAVSHSASSPTQECHKRRCAR